MQAMAASSSNGTRATTRPVQQLRQWFGHARESGRMGLRHPRGPLPRRSAPPRSRTITPKASKGPSPSLPPSSWPARAPSATWSAPSSKAASGYNLHRPWEEVQRGYSFDEGVPGFCAEALICALTSVSFGCPAPRRCPGGDADTGGHRQLCGRGPVRRRARRHCDRGACPPDPPLRQHRHHLPGKPSTSPGSWLLPSRGRFQTVTPQGRFQSVTSRPCYPACTASSASCAGRTSDALSRNPSSDR